MTLTCMLKPYVVKLSKNNLQEGIVEQKKCEKCDKQFTITNKDSVLLKKFFPASTTRPLKYRHQKEII